MGKYLLIKNSNFSSVAVEQVNIDQNEEINPIPSYIDTYSFEVSGGNGSWNYSKSSAELFRGFTVIGVEIYCNTPGELSITLITFENENSDKTISKEVISTFNIISGLNRYTIVPTYINPNQSIGVDTNGGKFYYIKNSNMYPFSAYPCPGSESVFPDYSLNIGLYCI